MTMRTPISKFFSSNVQRPFSLVIGEKAKKRRVIIRTNSNLPQNSLVQYYFNYSIHLERNLESVVHSYNKRERRIATIHNQYRLYNQ